MVSRNKLRRHTSTAVLCSTLVYASLRLDAQAASPTVPTANVEAEDLAQQWKDSVSKYDSARSRDAQRGRSRRARWSIPSGLGFALALGSAGVVQGREVRHLHSLGRVLGAGLWQRVVPAEDVLQGTPENKHQIETYGPLTKFGYKDFIPMFKAEHYDPAGVGAAVQGVGREVRRAGVRASRRLPDVRQRVCRTGPRQRWGRSATSPAILRRPCGPRDCTLVPLLIASSTTGSWMAAAKFPPMSTIRSMPRSMGRRKCNSRRQTSDGSNLAQDWTYVSPAYADDWLARSAEIVKKYHPDFIFFDWWIGQPSVRPYLAKFAAYYYNESQKNGPVGIISYKWVDMQEHRACSTSSADSLQDIRPQYWQTDTSVSNKSWGYIEHDTFKTPDLHRRSAGRRRQQEWKLAHEHRAALRWNDSGRGAAGSPGQSVVGCA